MSIPLVNLKRMHENLKDDITQAVSEVYDRGDFILGKEVSEFEEKFAEYLGCKHVIGVSSGLDALKISLAAIGVGEKSNVIVPNNTFIATAFAVSSLGANIVLADCDETFNMNPSLANKICDEMPIDAIIPVHMTGQAFDYGRLSGAIRRNISIIEDACQAHGAKHGDSMCGTIGNAGCFSFYPGKNLGGIGDAGAISTNRDDIAAFARQYRHYGQDKKYSHCIKGGNCRMDTVQAAVLLQKLKHLDTWNKKRRSVAKLYDEMIGYADLPVELPERIVGCEHVFHLYMLRVEDLETRDALLAYLNENEVGAGIHYPITVSDSLAYGVDYSNGDCPVSRDIANRIISLPCCPFIGESEQLTVVEHIIDFYNRREQ